MATTQESNRLTIGRILGIFAIAFFLMIGFTTNYIKAEEGEKKVTILHTNDIHAQIDDFAKLAAYKKKAEEESDIFFYVDAGDIFSGNPVVDMNDGEPIVELLNLVGLDLIGIGNHEYDYGVEALNERIEQANFPFLSANTEVTTSKYKQPKPYWTTEKDGVTFGFIALTQAPPATAPKNIEGIEFHSYKETIEKYAHELKGVDVLIGVNHIGLNEDRKLAEEFDIFDAIIGGHSHTEMKKEEVINDTTIVQTGSHLNNVGNMTITLGEDNNVESIDWTLQPIEDLTEKDDNIQQSIDKYNAQMEDQLTQEIGETKALNRGARYERDTSLGNFWTDALRRVVDNSDIAVTNNGGIRADIPAGMLTYGDIYKVEPFGNEVMVIEMTGDAILDVLEYSYTRDDRNQIDLQTSGLEYVINTDIYGALDHIEATVDGQTIDENETYTVVVPDYIGTGGSGYDFKGEVITGKAGLMTDAMIDYAEALIQRDGIIDVVAENRIEIVTADLHEVSIAEAQQLKDGDWAQLEGVVLTDIDFLEEGSIYMNDGTAGLIIDKPHEDVVEGDYIQLIGKIQVENGEVKFSSVSEIEIMEENYALPEPRRITIEEINNLSPGELVSLDSYAFIDTEILNEEGSFKIDLNVSTKEDAKHFPVIVDHRLGMSHEDISKNDMLEVTGIVRENEEGLYIQPRNVQDIIIHEGEEEKPEDLEKPVKDESTSGGPSDSDEKNNNKTEDVPSVTDEDNDNLEGSALPKTATNTWNILLIGGVLFILGSGLLFVIQRKRSMSN